MADRSAVDSVPAHRYLGAPFLPGTPAISSMLDHVDRQAAARGDAPYLTVVGEGPPETLDYRALDRDSRRIAEWLTGLGLPDGAPVGLLPVNDIPSVVAIYGAMRARHPVLFLNPADPVARLREQTEALGVEVVLRGPAVADAALPVGTALPDPRTLPDPPRGAPPVPAPVPADADALYFGTSGSTAASKLVAQTHANCVANAEAMVRHHRLGPGNRFLGCLPIHHVNGVHLTLFATLAAGAHGILAERFSPFGYPSLLTRFRPRVASVVPSVLDALAASWRRPELPREFAYFVSAAAPLSTETARAVHDRLGARVLQGYGLTETTNFSTTLPTGLSDAAYRRLMLDTDIPSIGTAVHGNEVAVLLPDGSRAAAGQVGELCVRGHNVMSRYANNAAATADAFRGGWFHSQDLGRATTDESTGQPLYVLTGRIKNTAKIRGETVSLEEMERALRALPGVRDAACAALPDRLLGETVAAAVSAPPDLSDSEVLAHLRRHFAEAVLPSRVVRVDQVPRTATGKILRPALGELLTPSARTAPSSSPQE
ncbi:class I adenylate-forming enzyme family protein [Streptomyces sp. NPDC001770]